MTFIEFILEVDKEYRASKGMRYGQVAFNTLVGVRPDLAEKVRGTLADPFYVEYHQTSGTYLRFIDFLLDNWT